VRAGWGTWQGAGRGNSGVLTEVEGRQSMGEVAVLAGTPHSTTARASSHHVDVLKVRRTNSSQ
jgi:hypothetical protein